MMTDYYVSTIGDDGNPGTEAEPFANVQTGIDACDPGDRVLLMSGTWSYDSTDDRVIITTPNISLLSQDVENPGILATTTNWPNNTDALMGILDLFEDNITVDGVKFTSPSGSYIHRAITADLYPLESRAMHSGCTIKNCTFYDIHDGVHTNYQSKITIIDNVFAMKNTGDHQNAIFVNGVSDGNRNHSSVIKRNTIYYLTSSSESREVGGIRIGSFCGGVDVSFNNISHMSNAGGTGHDCGGIVVSGYVSTPSTGVKIYNNTLFNLKFYLPQTTTAPSGGIVINGQDMEVFNNLIVDCDNGITRKEFPGFDEPVAGFVDYNMFWKCDNDHFQADEGVSDVLNANPQWAGAPCGRDFTLLPSSHAVNGGRGGSYSHTIGSHNLQTNNYGIM